MNRKFTTQIVHGCCLFSMNFFSVFSISKSQLVHTNHTFVTIHEHLHSKPLAKLKQWYFTDLEVYAQKNIGFFNPYFRTKPSLQWEHFCGFVPWRNMMFVVVWVAWANKKELYQFEWIWKCMFHVIQFDVISYYTYHMYNHFVRELFIHVF